MLASKQHSLFCNLTKFHLARYRRLAAESHPVNRISWLRDGNRIKKAKVSDQRKREGKEGTE